LVATAARSSRAYATKRPPKCNKAVQGADHSTRRRRGKGRDVRTHDQERLQLSRTTSSRRCSGSASHSRTSPSGSAAPLVPAARRATSRSSSIPTTQQGRMSASHWRRRTSSSTCATRCASWTRRSRTGARSRALPCSQGWTSCPGDTPFQPYGNRALVVYDPIDGDDLALRLACSWARWVARRQLGAGGDTIDLDRVGSLIEDARQALRTRSTIDRALTTSANKITEAKNHLGALVGSRGLRSPADRGRDRCLTRRTSAAGGRDFGPARRPEAMLIRST